MSFLRTVSGAFATSLTNTAWEDGIKLRYAELVEQLDRFGDALQGLQRSGLSLEAARAAALPSDGGPGGHAGHQPALSRHGAGFLCGRLHHLAGTQTQAGGGVGDHGRVAADGSLAHASSAERATDG